MWTAEDNADRVKAMEAIAAGYTEQTGTAIKIVPVAEDQMASQVAAAAAAEDLPDVFSAVSLGTAYSLAADGITSPAAATSVINTLGPDTFSPRALELVKVGDEYVSVPSDSWLQLLLYRKDLFEKAGLEPPTTVQGMVDAAKALNDGSLAGIVASTGPADSFTQQTFEDVALANGCQVVDDAGAVTIDSPQCVETFAAYADMIANGSVAGIQDADTTRAAYFAGNAAMMIWSSFILDEMAGLRNDALPTCPECEADPLFLANNTGIVTALEGAGGESALFGEMVSFAIAEGDQSAAAESFVEYMMGEGYVDWLALAPEGKFPTRLGTAENPTEYADAWQTLSTGVDTKAPLSELYSAEVLAALTSGVDSMTRWGFPQGQGQLVGPLLVELPVPAALAQVIDGTLTPEEGAAEAKAQIEEILASLG